MALASSPRRLSILPIVGVVPRQSWTYPACAHCLAKMTRTAPASGLPWECFKCRSRASLPLMRYALAVLIELDGLLQQVTVFGNALRTWFGILPNDFASKHGDCSDTLIHEALSRLMVTQVCALTFKAPHPSSTLVLGPVAESLEPMQALGTNVSKMLESFVDKCPESAPGDTGGQSSGESLDGASLTLSQVDKLFQGLHMSVDQLDETPGRRYDSDSSGDSSGSSMSRLSNSPTASLSQDPRPSHSSLTVSQVEKFFQDVRLDDGSVTQSIIVHHENASQTLSQVGSLLRGLDLADDGFASVKSSHDGPLGDSKYGSEGSSRSLEDFGEELTHSQVLALFDGLELTPSGERRSAETSPLGQPALPHARPPRPPAVSSDSEDTDDVYYLI